MTEIKLPIDLPVAARMGLQGLVAAVLIDDGKDPAVPWEIAIQQPGFLPSGEDWAVIEHFDTDPENDTQGSSGVASFDTYEEALDEFRRLVGQADRKVPGYLVSGSSVRGKRVFLAIDTFSSGYPYFTDSLQLAEWYPNAAAAHRALQSIVKIAVSGEKVDIDSFAAFPSEYLTRSVASDAEAGAAPTGWRFVVSSPDGALFKMPERHWKQYGGVNEASPYSELAEARARCGEHEFPLMVKRQMSNKPLQASHLAALISSEDYARSGEPEVTPAAGVAYAPR